MKLYCLTDATNLNNILSTGSISPSGFYGQRSFGIKSWDEECFSAPESHLIAFDACPPCVGFWNAVPLVVEIDSTLVEVGAISEVRLAGFVAARVFAISSTVYLKDDKVRFILPTEQDVLEAKTATKRSIEVKLAGFFDKAIVSRDSIDVQSFAVGVSGLTLEEQKPSREALKRDECVNRARGFLYGYVLGANRYVGRASKLYLDAVALCEEYRNELSAAVSSAGSASSATVVWRSKTWEKLSQMRLAAVGAGAGKKGRSEAAKRIVDRHEGAIGDDAAVDLKHDEEDIFASYMEGINEFVHMLTRSYPTLLDVLAPTFGKGGFEEINDYVDACRKEIDSGYRACVVCLRREDTPQIDSTCSVDSECFSQPYDAVMSDILSEEDLSKRLFDASSGEEPSFSFASACGSVVRREMGGSWEGSPERKYFNRLLNNLKGNLPEFSIEESDEPFLRSFAAFCKFCQTGRRSNFNEFYETLLSKRIADTRIAMSLWGATFGFAAMPKTLTGEFFDECRLYSRGIVDYVDEQIERIGGSREYCGRYIPDELPVLKGTIEDMAPTVFTGNESINSFGVQDEGLRNEDFWKGRASKMFESCGWEMPRSYNESKRSFLLRELQCSIEDARSIDEFFELAKCIEQKEIGVTKGSMTRIVNKLKSRWDNGGNDGRQPVLGGGEQKTEAIQEPLALEMVI